MKREGHPLLPTSHFLYWLDLLFPKHWKLAVCNDEVSISVTLERKTQEQREPVFTCDFKNKFHAMLVNNGHNMGSFIGINFL